MLVAAVKAELPLCLWDTGGSGAGQLHCVVIITYHKVLITIDIKYSSKCFKDIVDEADISDM